jgi:hypothetical protein
MQLSRQLDSAEGRRTLVAGAAVPLLLALLSAIQLATRNNATEYLLLPPLAVIVYLVFRNLPEIAAFRSVVALPCLGAIVGELCSHYFGLTPAGVAIATLAILLLQAALRANMPPALALGVLAMLLRAEGFSYVLGVLEGTLIVFIAAALWRRFSPTGWA